MKLTPVIGFVSVVGWLFVAGLVLDVNVAPRGFTTVQWPRPTQSTAWFRWSGTPLIRDHQIVLEQTPAVFRVTLPRGFVRGRIVVETQPNSGQLAITGDDLPGQSGSTTTNHIPGQWMTIVRWADLAARGRTFNITLTATGQPVTIKSIRVNLQRS